MKIERWMFEGAIRTVIHYRGEGQGGPIDKVSGYRRKRTPKKVFSEY